MANKNIKAFCDAATLQIFPFWMHSNNILFDERGFGFYLYFFLFCAESAPTHFSSFSTRALSIFNECTPNVIKINVNKMRWNARFLLPISPPSICVYNTLCGCYYTIFPPPIISPSPSSIPRSPPPPPLCSVHSLAFFHISLSYIFISIAFALSALFLLLLSEKFTKIR